MNSTAQVVNENAEEIMGFTAHGWRAIKTLQAQCRLLQELPKVATDNLEAMNERTENLTHAIAGMEEHLRILHDVVQHAEIYAREIIDAGDQLAATPPLIRYIVCLDSKKEYPFESEGSGTEHPTAEAAAIELRQVRRKQPTAYVARVVYQRCTEPMAESQASKKKLRAA